MKYRNPFTVFVLALVTFGVYEIVWLAKTRGEMVRKGAEIPTTFLIIVPLANLFYIWKYSQGVEHVSQGKMQWFVVLLLHMLLGPIGTAVIQDTFNKVPEAVATTAAGSDTDQQHTPSTHEV